MNSSSMVIIFSIDFLDTIQNRLLSSMYRHKDASLIGKIFSMIRSYFKIEILAKEDFYALLVLKGLT